MNHDIIEHYRPEVQHRHVELAEICRIGSGGDPAHAVTTSAKQKIKISERGNKT